MSIRNMKNLPNGSLASWVKLLTPVLLTIVITFGIGWASAAREAHQDHDLRLTTIEANRFTAKDALEMKLSLAEVDAAILNSLASLTAGQAANDEQLKQIREELNELRRELNRRD